MELLYRLYCDLDTVLKFESLCDSEVRLFIILSDY